MNMQKLNIVLLPLFAIALIWLAIIFRTPTFDADKDYPLDSFSANRAMEHLKVITQKRHPIGSTNNKLVRQYIVDEFTRMGAVVEVKPTLMTIPWSRDLRTATTENIVAYFPGSNPMGKALVLTTHYDSVNQSVGASDAGHAVAVILETARALKHAEKPLANDVYFVLSDGEEKGLIGAKALMKDVELIRKWGMVLNFEARGSSGPVYLFETSANNENLIAEFIDAVPGVVGDSLLGAAYDKMANDTDFTVYKSAGISGLNFGYFNDYYHYHTMADNTENIDLGSLQQAGGYALSAALHFGHLALPVVGNDNDVYFNVANKMAQYDMWVVYLVTLLAAILWIIVMLRAKRLESFNYVQLFSGIVAILLQMVIVFILVHGLYQWLLFLTGSATDVFAQQSMLQWLFVLGAVGFCLLWQWAVSKGMGIKLILVLAVAIGAVSALSGAKILAVFGLIVVPMFFLFRQALPVAASFIGGLSVWLLLSLLATFVIPSASHLFSWPLLICLCFELWRQQRQMITEQKAVLLNAIGGAAGVFFWVNYIDVFYNAFGHNIPGMPMAFIPLLFVLWLPALHRNTVLGNQSSVVKSDLIKLVPLPLCAALILFVLAAFGDPYNSRYPRQTELFYLYDDNQKQGYWASSDKAPDDWVKSFVKEDSKKVEFSTVVPHSQGTLALTPVDGSEFPAAKIEVISDSIDGKWRTLAFKLKPSWQSAQVSLYIKKQTRVKETQFNGNSVRLRKAYNGWHRWTHYGMPDEGVTISLKVLAGTTLALKTVEMGLDFPENKRNRMESRPEKTMAKIDSLSDATVVVAEHIL